MSLPLELRLLLAREPGLLTKVLEEDLRRRRMVQESQCAGHVPVRAALQSHDEVTLISLGQLHPIRQQIERCTTFAAACLAWVQGPMVQEQSKNARIHWLRGRIPGLCFDSLF